MDNCIFCKIINGDIPSATLYEDEEFIALLDRFPCSLGHTLIIPKEHSKNIFDIDAKKAGRLFSLAVKIATVLKDALGYDNLNVLQNNGELAGQTVHHFHLHIIPRKASDSIDIKWSPLSLSDEKIDDIKTTIIEKF